MYCYQNYTSSNTSPTVPDVPITADNSTTNYIGTTIRLQVNEVTSEASDLPATTPPPPPRPVRHWGVPLQKARPFFAPRPEFHARSNPGGR